MKTFTNYCLIALLLLFSVCSFAAPIRESTVKNEILFITSYNSDSKHTYENINDFVETYKRLGGTCTTIVENMNVIGLEKVSEWNKLMIDILAKHPTARLVILLGGEAWTSFFHLEGEAYKKIPVICAMASRYGILIPQTDDLDIDTYTPRSIDFFERMKEYNVKACYAVDYDIDKSIELIRSFYPSLQTLAFLSDNTYTGLVQETRVKAGLKRYPELSVTFIDGRTLSLDEATDRVAQLAEHSVLLLGQWRIDSQRTSYMNNSIFAFTQANPQLPTFSLTSNGIGYWSIGGYVPDVDLVGHKIGEQAFQLIDRNRNLSHEFTLIPSVYKFDANKLEAFGFEESTLPQTSVIVNNKESFFDLYQMEMSFITVVFLVLLTALLFSLYYYYKTKGFKNNLQKLATQLTKDKQKLEKSENDLRTAKEQAEEASRLKSAFVSNISHEIRTPLNAIVGFSSMLVDNQGFTPEQKEFASIIQINSDLLLQLINDILDVSRLESGKIQFHYEPCDLTSHCQNMIAMTNRSKRVDVEVKFAPHPQSYLLYTDPLRLQEIVTNLLNNALKFTPPGGCITLDYTPDQHKGEVLFSVTDTGQGIPLEKQGLIFERFEKLDEFVQGTGLGLPICKLIIQRMGGEIWVDSEYTDGARFVFSHPIR